jgi:hypothetical protein
VTPSFRELEGILEKYRDRVVDGLVLEEIERDFIAKMHGGTAIAHADGDGSLHVDAITPEGERIYSSIHPGDSFPRRPVDLG